MSDDPRLDEYLLRLRGEVADAAIEAEEGTDDVGVVSFREDAFTEVILGSLEDHGQVSDVNVCFLERRLGRGFGRVNAWHCDPDNGLVTLVTTIFRGLGDPGSITRTELTQATERAIRVFLAAREGYHKEMEPASDAFDMMERLHEVSGSVDRVRVVLIGDGFAADPGTVAVEAEGVEVQLDVWDLRRLFRVDSSGLPYEPVEIDLVERMGRPLPCIASPDAQAGFDVYLAILPGELLHDLYHEYGPRLLELNVRSFLQARGKVNRGIRDTLKNEPHHFMAYNNGISATAEFVETVVTEQGLAITKLRGLQVVNGGQTVASIHRAKDRDRLDLSSVFIQSKLTIVQPDQVETVVPLISRYANTQNRVNEADFSANHPFHVKLQQLSQAVWAPGEQSRWFYERARGQYHVAQQRDGTTPARLKRFKQANPPRQRFDKVKVAKYVNAWGQLPHIVSRGGQKNFLAFMKNVQAQWGQDWLPDADYFKAVVAQAIIFKHAESVARKHNFPGYRANAIAYTVAMVSYRTAERIDLDSIWNDQAVSEPLADTLFNWMPVIYKELIESAGGFNVTEWCKKEDCWRRVQAVDLEVSEELEAELTRSQPLSMVGSSTETGHSLPAAHRENIARVMQVPAETWLHIFLWGAQTGHLNKPEIRLVVRLWNYATHNWQKIPGRHTARRGVDLIEYAALLGGMPQVED